jgi:hypothetical protein
VKLKYGVGDKPPLEESLSLGLQWCAPAAPFMIILVKVTWASPFQKPSLNFLIEAFL